MASAASGTSSRKAASRDTLRRRLPPSLQCTKPGGEVRTAPAARFVSTPRRCRGRTLVSAAMNAPAAPLLDQFARIVGAPNALRDPAAITPYVTEPREKFTGKTPLVLRPGSVAEVAAIVKLANETRTPIVPQGGNTGVVGGPTPSSAGNETVVAVGRLN